MNVFIGQLMLEDLDPLDCLVYQAANATLEGAVDAMVAALFDPSAGGLEGDQDKIREQLLKSYREDGEANLGDDYGIVVSIDEVEVGA